MQIANFLLFFASPAFLLPVPKLWRTSIK